MLETTTIAETPVGPLTLEASPRGLTGLRFGRSQTGAPTGPPARGVLAEARRQLEQYFAGRRRAFGRPAAIPLDLRGTPFQLAVWRALLEIPCGATASYRQIAARIGRPGAARAVGAANRANPVSIIVPCHRVIGSDGALTGYGGGLANKERLLRLEASSRPRVGRSDCPLPPIGGR